jgi:hypothetical protein
MVFLRNNNQNPEPPACRLVSFYYPTGQDFKQSFFRFSMMRLVR